MLKFRQLLLIGALCFLSGLLSACSPQYNWREVHGNSVPFTVLMPGKADAFTQPVELNSASVAMTMTATEIEGVTFAVGTATFPDAAAAQNALGQMKTALIKNIGSSQIDATIASPDKEIANAYSVALSANGSASGKPIRMSGRLYNIEKRVYQVIMVGDPQKMSSDNSEMFFTSFKPN